MHENDGSVVRITALVDEDMIYSDNVEVNIEEDDIFECTLPNGVKEYYKVVDCGFYKGSHGISDNSQSKVKRISSSVAESRLNSMTKNDKPHKIFISHSSKVSGSVALRSQTASASLKNTMVPSTSRKLI